VFDADPTHLWRKLVDQGELQEVRLMMPFGNGALVVKSSHLLSRQEPSEGELDSFGNR
jgi:hypothetical protein